MEATTLKFYKYKPVAKTQYKDKFCSEPYKSIQIDTNGDVQLCDCTYYMPYTVGNVFENTLEEIWNGEQANIVRQSVVDGDFSYCSWKCVHLPFLGPKPDQLPSNRPFPRVIKLDMDISCNLKCPSCRESVVIEKNTTIIQKQTEIFEQIRAWALANPDMFVKVVPLGRGEIFASHSGLAFLRSLQDYPHDNIELWLVTNGTLITRNQELLESLDHVVSEWSVSIDAATPETYAKVRGANWNDVTAGLELLKKYSPEKIKLNFCVQKNNYHEIEQFAELALQYGNTIQYQKLDDWGHWDDQWWQNNNAFDRTKDSFNQALDQLERVQHRYPGQINLAADLTKYIDKRQ